MQNTSPICFLADVHLSQGRPDILERFHSFISDISSDISSLYILGDLFDFWIGDDAAEVIGLTNVAPLLKGISERVNIYLMHGNRDFLIGGEFAKAAGATLINDLHRLELDNHRVLLSHGDRWCIDDRDYMGLRTKVLNPNWQRAALSLSVEERLKIAKDMRQGSETATKEKQWDIMDVNQPTVAKDVKEHDCDIVIHGHTHRPDIHNEDGYQRYVLGDWFHQQSWLMWRDGSFHTSNLN